MGISFSMLRDVIFLLGVYSFDAVHELLCYMGVFFFLGALGDDL